MNRISSLYRTTVGKKFIAAVTGLILFGFLVGHMAGNLKFFTGMGGNGVPHIDEYGQALKVFGAPFLPNMIGLWTARFVLLISLILHVAVVSQLALQNVDARPIGYQRRRKRAASLSAQWMMYSGALIFAFIIFHILHLTTGTIQLGRFDHGYVFNNLRNSFERFPVAAGYTLMMIVLGFHLYHGVWSMFQTLGLDNPDRNRWLRMFAVVMTVVVSAGFAALPVSFLLGVVPNPVEYARELLLGH
jgi:succinate dehydrogenase / fumarate reductase, cytochrome b subunit